MSYRLFKHLVCSALCTAVLAVHLPFGWSQTTGATGNQSVVKKALGANYERTIQLNTSGEMGTASVPSLTLFTLLMEKADLDFVVREDLLDQDITVSSDPTALGAGIETILEVEKLVIAQGPSGIIYLQPTGSPTPAGNPASSAKKTTDILAKAEFRGPVKMQLQGVNAGELIGMLAKRMKLDLATSKAQGKLQLKIRSKPVDHVMLAALRTSGVDLTATEGSGLQLVPVKP